MATGDEIYRLYYNRRHKILGPYLVLKAWQLGVDCVALRRLNLLKFLKLESMSRTHVGWIIDDLREFFPYQWDTVDARSNAYATLYLSRSAFPEEGKTGSMRDDERVQKFEQYGLKVAVIEIPDEEEILTSMSLLTGGLAS